MGILYQLKDLKNDAVNSSVRDAGAGICHHIDGLINPSYIWSWVNFSGNFSYPIFDKENEKYSTPERQFYSLNLWQGRQLELRLSLIDHLIKCYEAESK